MFWIPSNKPLDPNGWRRAGAPEQTSRHPALGLQPQRADDGLTQRPLLFLPLLLLIGALLWRRNALYARLNKVHQDIGHFKRDSQWHTPQAILINILLAMPVALGLALCGYALQIDARGQNANLGAACCRWPRPGWCSTPPTASSRRAAWPNCISAGRNPRSNSCRLDPPLGLVVLALVAVVAVAEHQPAALADDVLGIAVVLTCYALMAWLLSRLLISSPTHEKASLFRKAWAWCSPPCPSPCSSPCASATTTPRSNSATG
jgi:potassium efflux system protein